MSGSPRKKKLTLVVQTRFAVNIHHEMALTPGIAWESVLAKTKIDYPSYSEKEIRLVAVFRGHHKDMLR